MKGPRARTHLPERTVRSGHPRFSEQGIDERCYHRSLRQNHQAAERNQHDHDGQEPELLAFPHKRPEFHYKIAHGHLLLMFDIWMIITLAPATVQYWYFI